MALYERECYTQSMALQKRRKELAISEKLKQETVHIDAETEERGTQYLKRGLRVTSVLFMIVVYTGLVGMFCILIYK